MFTICMFMRAWRQVEKLMANPLLASLELAGNPVTAQAEYRLRVSFRLPR